MRSLFVRLHRWFGLAAAIFLFISGLTGAIISWDHELDEWLNPQLFHARTEGQPMAPLELARRVEAADPRIRISYMPLEVEPGHAWTIFVEGRIDPATGQPYDLGFNQMAIDPATGEVQGKRFWGAISLTRENLLPFLYKLHYTMHIPDGWGIELGKWFMGLIAMAWVLDCFIALWLSFPNWSAWRKSLAFRWKKGGYALNFDLHRSGGVWLWGLFLLLAVTSVSMNLETQVMRPLVSKFSTLSPNEFDNRTPRPLNQPHEPAVSREQVIAAAREEATRRGWTDPAGGIFYSSMYGLYGVGFFAPGNDHGDGGLGNPWLYFDGATLAPAGGKIPGTGSAGDIFLQAQFPLHSGRILGLPGRVMISLMGLAVATLCATGVIIWARKRAGRAAAAAQRAVPRAQPVTN
ncbi:putative iron-regulated membrane protein [Cupriavidus gilardii J11]|uniref:Putative iron-regulated membrane protein n=1 Tax=Cupriavidus gilardii J11 TaxID=936133 RepID=A0A562BA93_9BURK|nr:PepSY-associated TM helix domain-containing protein [Cupriavidus gilardii]TWG81879.1 putative iron-regulated membrane protein [Cupriavidus gilardii J11]